MEKVELKFLLFAYTFTYTHRHLFYDLCTFCCKCIDAVFFFSPKDCVLQAVYLPCTPPCFLVILLMFSFTISC